MNHLLDYLNAQRRHVLGIVDGLDDEAMRRSTLPTGWTPVGMLGHLTDDIEAFWFHGVVGGDPAFTARFDPSTPDGFQVDPDRPVADVVAGYRAAIDRSDEILARAPLDAPPAWWPAGLFGDWTIEDTGAVILHVMVETACHAGHLDAARELIDGRTWLVLP